VPKYQDVYSSEWNAAVIDGIDYPATTEDGSEMMYDKTNKANVCTESSCSGSSRNSDSDRFQR